MPGKGNNATRLQSINLRKKVIRRNTEPYETTKGRDFHGIRPQRKDDEEMSACVALGSVEETQTEISDNKERTQGKAEHDKDVQWKGVRPKHNNPHYRGATIGGGRNHDQQQESILGHDLNQRTHHQSLLEARSEVHEDYEPMDEPALKFLAASEDISSITETLTDPLKGFKALLDKDEIPATTAAHVILTLSKVFNKETNPNPPLQLLVHLRHSHFLKTHLNVFFMTLLSLNSNDEYIDKNMIIAGTLNILSMLLQRLPSSADVVLGPLTILGQCIPLLQGQGIKHTEQYSEDLNELLESCNETLSSCHKTKERINISVEDTWKPPNDFRKMTIFPTSNDIHTEGKPFLRSNKVTGPYMSLDHYLDVHFRLLREDFIRPLRHGISQYKHMIATRTREKNTDIRVYQSVFFVCPLESSSCYQIRFDSKRVSSLSWQYAKRLIYGSLVCLSKDNFVNFIFGTVANSNTEDLKEGFIDIRLEKLSDINHISTHEEYTMVESSAYFEAYRHVLQGLKTVTAKLPFQPYIIYANEKVEPPKYLQDHPNSRIDLSFLFKEQLSNDTEKRCDKRLHDVTLPSVVAVAGDNCEEHSAKVAKNPLANNTKEHLKPALTEVKIMEGDTWPSAERLELDEPQLEAFRLALTHELALIQGPPGTGKTFIGLLIVKTLLQNVRLWNNIDPNAKAPPILIVCYTNHALDQFLEGIIEFTSGKVVRVGGRCTNDNVSKCSLSVMRRQQDSNDLRSQRFEIKTNELVLDNKILKLSEKLESCQRGLLHEQYLSRYIMDAHFKDLCYFASRSDEPKPGVLSWLGLDELSQYIANSRKRKTGLEDKSTLSAKSVLNEEVIKEIDALLQTSANKRNEQLALVINDFKDIIKTKHESRKVYENMKRKADSVMNELKSTDVMSQYEAESTPHIRRLKYRDRWRLYRYWLQNYKEELKSQIKELGKEYEKNADDLNAINTEIDQRILETAMVIGMTTTGAAKHRDVLHKIQPKIIVVEEAAEVLEAHIITTLCQECQHLILIGDHKQLRPNPTDYELAEKYNLKISLFERLVRNGVSCATLEQQYRMRPEISKIVRNVYPDLKDHGSVGAYENIKGISHNVFFLDHKEWETDDEANASKSNLHEAEYLGSLCRYLIQQGYTKEQITVLTPYTGQLRVLKNCLNKNDCIGIRVTAIDNYQGEENDIVLVSLVRSNPDNKAGFVKDENRVCVALSRAKMGLYIIGNFELLQKKSSLWRNVIRTVQESQCLGKSLPVNCQNHLNDKHSIEITCGADLRQIAPEGGCTKPCLYRLECGHVCTRICHPDDKAHTEFKCRKACIRKICDMYPEHVCPLLCFEKCKQCMILVAKVLPECGHEEQVVCSVKPENHSCMQICGKLVCSDHTLVCDKKCHMPCDKCMTLVTKKIPKCKHEQDMPCSKAPEDHICTHICGMISCESHNLKCKKICHAPCDSLDHNRGCDKNCHMPCDRCMTLVNKKIPKCKHEQDMPCFKAPEDHICTHICGMISCESHNLKCKKICHAPCDRCLEVIKQYEESESDLSESSTSGESESDDSESSIPREIEPKESESSTSREIESKESESLTSGESESKESQSPIYEESESKESESTKSGGNKSKESESSKSGGSESKESESLNSGGSESKESKSSKSGESESKESKSSKSGESESKASESSQSGGSDSKESKSSKSGESESKESKSSKSGESESKASESSQSGGSESKESKSSKSVESESKESKSSKSGESESKASESSQSGGSESKESESSNSGGSELKESESSKSGDSESKESESSKSGEKDSMESESLKSGESESKESESSESGEKESKESESLESVKQIKYKIPEYLKYRMHKECMLPCDKCMVMIKKKIPTCGHKQDVPCSISPKNQVCTYVCGKTSCENHNLKCKKKCHVTCEECLDFIKIGTIEECTEANRLQIVNKMDVYYKNVLHEKCIESCDQCGTLTTKIIPRCKHEQEVTCSTAPEDIKCTHKCGKVTCSDHNMECQKECHAVCNTCNHGRYTFRYEHDVCGLNSTITCDKCMTLTTKVIPKCGHEQEMPCFMTPKNYKKCTTLTTKEMPKCLHMQQVPCSVAPTDFTCKGICQNIVCKDHGTLCDKEFHRTCDGCKTRMSVSFSGWQFRSCVIGRPTKQSTHKNCRLPCIKCMVLTTKKMTKCGHEQQIPCSVEPEKVKCMHICGKIACSEHNVVCKKACHKECEKCAVLMSKVLPSCGHKQQVLCSVEPENVKCTFMVQKTLPCGHMIDTKCSNDLGTVYCSSKCTSLLRCGHQCHGTCGKCFQGRLHLPCVEKCEKVLICGHVCRGICSQICRPCTHPCENRCAHQKCQHECGTSCIPCRKPCAWKCAHKICTKMCFEPCDRTPCDKFCTKRLKCKHQCSGICGEICPSKCKKCDRDDLVSVSFGRENKKNVRFVQLVECGHIFEVTGLDQWVKKDQDSITMKCCPKCGTRIGSVNLRYKAIINMKYQNIEDIKYSVLILNKQNINEYCNKIIRKYKNFNDNQLPMVKELKREADVCHLLKRADIFFTIDVVITIFILQKETLLSKFNDYRDSITTALERQLDQLYERTIQFDLHDNERSEIRTELKRLFMFCKLISIANREFKFRGPETDGIVKTQRVALSHFTSNQVRSSDDMDQARKCVALAIRLTSPSGEILSEVAVEDVTLYGLSRDEWLESDPTRQT